MVSAHLVVLIKRQVLRSKHNPEPLPLLHAAFHLQAQQITIPYDPLFILLHVKATRLAGISRGDGTLLWRFIRDIVIRNCSLISFDERAKGGLSVALRRSVRKIGIGC